MKLWDFIFNLGTESIKKTSAIRARKQMFQKLGELTYALSKSSQIDNEAINVLVREIDELNEKIKQHNLSNKY